MVNGSRDRGWVWFDFENTPHVLFLEPLIRRLERGGWRVGITAKPQAQTLELAAARGFSVHAAGAGDRAGWARKVLGVVGRATRLARWVWARGRPRLLVSSSRSASLAAWALRVPAIALLDYEHAEQRALRLGCRSLWLPDLLRSVPLPRGSRRIARFYPGLKENLYLDDWSLDRDRERRALGLGDGECFVVARPPAESAHYASALGGRLWPRAVRELLQRNGTRVVVVARTAEQRASLAGLMSPGARVELPEHAVIGPALVTAADLVVGGGGTMNREAAVLGVPVWSVFTGPAPHIDEALAREGRLRWVRSEEELDRALSSPIPARRERRGPFPEGVAAIMADIEAYVAIAPGARV